MIKTWVHKNKSKLPTPWAFNIPKRYKRNTITAELCHAKHILSNLTNEVRPQLINIWFMVKSMHLFKAK